MYANSALFPYTYVDRFDNKMMPLWLLQRFDSGEFEQEVVKDYNYDFFVITDKKKRF